LLDGGRARDAVRVVLAVAQPPLPEGGPNGRCFVGLIRGLMHHGIDVRCLAARQWFARPEEPPADLPVEVIPVEPGESGWRFQVDRWRRPRGQLARPPFGDAIRRATLEADILHLEEVATAWCDEGVATPSVVHLHYRILRDRTLGAPWRPQFRHVAEFALAERAALRRHRYLIASSPVVAADLRARAPHAEVVLAPLSVDPQHYPRASLDGPPIAGLLASGAWPTTVAALRRLIDRVWPAIRDRAPGARLVVAGRGTDRLPSLRGRPAVEFLGEVPTAGGFLSDLSVMVFPQTRGTGMKVKVLESLACGLPVVTTPAGAEGIDAGDAILVEVDDERIADAAARLLRDPDERKERGAAARQAFKQRYAPAPATEPLVDLYRRMRR
jgi:glycosyltransferase involved in cell wall biosynthesis